MYKCLQQLRQKQKYIYVSLGSQPGDKSNLTTSRRGIIIYPHMEKLLHQFAPFSLQVHSPSTDSSSLSAPRFIWACFSIKGYYIYECSRRLSSQFSIPKPSQYQATGPFGWLHVRLSSFTVLLNLTVIYQQWTSHSFSLPSHSPLYKEYTQPYT